MRNPQPVRLHVPRDADAVGRSEMAPLPLTHHEILDLVAPFTARGRHVDLAASNRLERRLVFRAIGHAGDVDAQPDLRETLVLETGSVKDFRLTRHLALPGGLKATLYTEGADPGELLAQIEAVPLRRQVRAQPGFVIAENHRIDPSTASGRDAQDAAPARILTHATAQVGALTVSMKLPAFGSIPAELEFKAISERYDLPEDLLAVLGWS